MTKQPPADEVYDLAERVLYGLRTSTLFKSPIEYNDNFISISRITSDSDWLDIILRGVGPNGDVAALCHTTVFRAYKLMQWRWCVDKEVFVYRPGKWVLYLKRLAATVSDEMLQKGKKALTIPIAFQPISDKDREYPV